MVVYFATPMASTGGESAGAGTPHSFSESKIKRNAEMAEELRNAGFEVFLPQENQKRNGVETLAQQLNVIKNCEFLVILLSDTRGAYLEAGYAKALGKPVYAVKVKETRAYSDWMDAFFDYIASSARELIAYLKPE